MECVEFSSVFWETQLTRVTGAASDTNAGTSFIL